ncbi:MAG: HK97 gp10 family phage protein [Cellulosilyticum sp.]|nr:HK97 gp10 family phage protein [Cellulosilyticum sp.]
MSDIRVNINTNIMSEIETILAQRFERVGQYVENTAKENCPVDRGILRASIHHEADKDGTVIGTNIEYAIPVHEGHGKFTGKPFLKDAAYNNMSSIQNILGGG